MVGNGAWQVPADRFAVVWNGSDTLDEVAAKLKALVSGPVPRWAVMARAGQLRAEGVGLRALAPARPAAGISPAVRD